jgi:hypothetical protein
MLWVAIMTLVLEVPAGLTSNILRMGISVGLGLACCAAWLWIDRMLPGNNARQLFIFGVFSILVAVSLWFSANGLGAYSARAIAFSYCVFSIVAFGVYVVILLKRGR